MTIIHISRRVGRFDKLEKPTVRTEEKSTAESTIFKSVLARDRSIANHRNIGLSLISSTGSGYLLILAANPVTLTHNQDKPRQDSALNE